MSTIELADHRYSNNCQDDFLLHCFLDPHLLLDKQYFFSFLLSTKRLASMTTTIIKCSEKLVMAPIHSCLRNDLDTNGQPQKLSHRLFTLFWTVCLTSGCCSPNTAQRSTLSSPPNSLPGIEPCVPAFATGSLSSLCGLPAASLATTMDLFF